MSETGRAEAGVDSVETAASHRRTQNSGGDPRAAPCRKRPTPARSKVVDRYAWSMLGLGGRRGATARWISIRLGSNTTFQERASAAPFPCEFPYSIYECVLYVPIGLPRYENWISPFGSAPTAEEERGELALDLGAASSAPWGEEAERRRIARVPGGPERGPWRHPAAGRRASAPLARDHGSALFVCQ